MALLTGSIIDGDGGKNVPGRVQVITSQGEFVYPPDSILKIGPGDPFFYSSGTFSVDVPRGQTLIIVERGTEYVPFQVNLDLPAQGTVTVDAVLERWTELQDSGWHPGNTHIHYDEKESRPDDRLYLDPRVEDLRMTAVSILKRWDLDYATNKYPPGMLTEFSSAHHYVECGEENRHNTSGRQIKETDIGYGHIMLLNIQNVVHPVSRGALVDPFDPDYPPLIYACDDTHRQGGIVIWCHNGQGMEAPVAAVLGKIDAFNLFDPFWMDPEYDIYYRMLNAGIRLPASTGSDWFISSANRVYAHTNTPFKYESWLEALKNGRTFITNGPAISLTVQGNEPGQTVDSIPGGHLSTLTTWKSHYLVSEVELLFNGVVVARKYFPEGSNNGCLESDVVAETEGWIVARLRSTSRDSFHHPIFAHTSPVYVRSEVASPQKAVAASWFDRSIEQSLEWVRAKGKFYTDQQRREVVDLFREGQQMYKRMIK